MTTSAITVSGHNEFADWLKQASRAVTPEALEQGLETAAGEIKAAIAARLPNGIEEEDLDTDVTKNADGCLVDVGFVSKGHLARWIEYGHRVVGHRPELEDLGHVDSKPFIRPAVAASSDAAFGKCAETITEVMEKEGLVNVR